MRKKTFKLKERLDAQGREIIDPTPASIPIGANRPATLADQIRRLVRDAVSESAMQTGHETFEEADDFEVGEDYEPHSPYEMEFDPADESLPRPDKSSMREEEPETAPKNTIAKEETPIPGKAKEGAPGPVPEQKA